ncbi:MAG TPA: DUF3606 domain-containing protein [Usitatibacter sp.]|nr:DUF3606 domain-containing protein [Usitatibacter sp.]
MESSHRPRRRWSDERRINALDAGDRTYWCKFFGVEDQDLLAAVDKVGTSAEKVRQYLQRSLTNDWIVDGGRPERRHGAPSRRHFM